MSLDFDKSVRLVAFQLASQSDAYPFITADWTASIVPGRRTFSARLSFFTAQQETIIVKAYAGGQTPISESRTIEIIASNPAATVETYPATEVTAVAATLHGAVDTHGPALESAFFEYGPTTAYGSSLTGSVEPHPTRNADSVTQRIKGLAPGMTYHYRLVTSTNDGTYRGPDVVFTTPPNRAPVTFPRIVVLPPSKMVTIEPAASDPETEPEEIFTPRIMAVTQGSPGYVEITSGGQQMFYRTTTLISDQFTYILADKFGAQTQGTVDIRTPSVHLLSIAGTYTTGLVDIYHRRRGSISLQVSKTGAFSGRITFDGATRRFTNAFQPYRYFPYGEASEEYIYGLVFPRVGYMSWVLRIRYNELGHPCLTGKSVSAIPGIHCLIMPGAQLRGATDRVTQAGRYNLVFPNPGVASQSFLTVPQGHSFATMVVREKGGGYVISGRTADSLPFSSSGRMDAESKIPVYAGVGERRRALLSGILRFGQAEKVTGDFQWFQPYGLSSTYWESFDLNLQAEGERYVRPSGRRPVFPFAFETAPLVHVTIGAPEGDTISDDVVPLRGHRIDSGAGDPTRVHIAINPRTGLFSGTLSRPRPYAQRLRGIVRPSVGAGWGVAHGAFGDGGVEIQPAR